MTATLTEDRLVAALQARAGQVRPEDLAPLVTPEPVRGRPRWGAYALAAATIAAVVAAPFAVDAVAEVAWTWLPTSEGDLQGRLTRPGRT